MAVPQVAIRKLTSEQLALVEDMETQIDAKLLEGKRRVGFTFCPDDQVLAELRYRYRKEFWVVRTNLFDFGGIRLEISLHENPPNG